LRLGAEVLEDAAELLLLPAAALVSELVLVDELDESSAALGLNVVVAGMFESRAV
jgi:hypothetical protein